MRHAGTTLVALAILWTGARVGRSDDPAPGTPAAAPRRTAVDWTTELRAPETDRRRKAAYALWQLGPAAKDAIPALAAALRDDDEYVRTVADKVLTTFRMEKAPVGALEPAIPELIVGLADPRVEVRRLASGNLWRVGWPTKPPPPSLAPALIKAFRDPDAAVRARAAGVVVNHMGHLAETYDALKPLAADPDAGVRLWSLQALATLQPVTSAPLMISALADAEATVRAVAASNLGFPSIRLAPALPSLVAALADPDADVRRAAAYALSGLGTVLDTSSAVDRLLEGLKDADPATRAAAATGLEGTGSPRKIAPILALLDGEQPVEVRSAMVAALGNVGPEDVARVLDALETALSHDDEGVQVAAANALKRLGRAAAAGLPALLGAIGDPSETVRAAAVEGAIAVGGRGPEVVDKLIVALRFGGIRLRNATANALAALGADAKDAGALAIERLQGETDTGTRSMLLYFLAAAGAEPKAVLGAASAHAPDDPGGRVGTSFARARFSSSDAESRAAVDALVAALEPEETRWPAIYALRMLGAAADAAVPKLEEMARAAAARKESTSVYDRALLEIRGAGATRAWERARAALAGGDSWGPSVFEGLGAAAGPVIPDLVTAANARDVSLRVAAITTLGKLGVASDEVAAVLETRRRDPMASARRAAYDAESRLGLLTR